MAKQRGNSLALLSALGVLKPEKSMELVAKYNSQGLEWLIAFIMMGKFKTITNNTHSWFEDDYYQTPVTVASCSTNGTNVVTNTIVISNTTNASPTLTRGMTVTFLNGVKIVIYNDGTLGGASPNYTYTYTFKIINTAGATVTTDTLLNTYVSGGGAAAQAVIESSISGEGSGQVKSLNSDVTEMTNYIQIIKNQFTTTDLAEMSKPLWFDQYQGAALSGYTMKCMQEVDYQIIAKAAGALWNGDKAIHTGLGGVNRAGVATDAYETEGIWKSSIAYGSTHNPTIGAFNIIDDFDAFRRFLEINHITGGVHTALFGSDLISEINRSGYQFTKDGTDWQKIVKSSYGGKEDRALSVNFKAMSWGENVYQIVPMQMLSNPNLISSSWNYSNRGLIVPGGSVKDAKSAEKLDRFTVMFQGSANADKNLEGMPVKHWEFGGDSSNQTDEYSDTVINSTLHIGARTVAANQNICVISQ